MGLEGQVVTMTGFIPGQWTWTQQQASEPANEVTATLVVSSTGLYTVSLWAREDGLRIDRLLLTTDTTYLPIGFGPTETERQAGTGGLLTVVNRTIAYDYDSLYRLTSANYSTGQAYDYSYDPVGNRLQQIINGDTTTYLYDAANRLSQVGTQGYTQTYTFDANGNLLNTGVLTNVFDTANRLIETERDATPLYPEYDGLGNRVAQTVGATTTHFTLDVAIGLPEVIYTSEGSSYLHLPGVIVAENNAGERRYLLSDGLGSIRQAVDETGTVVAYQQFDPYGQLVQLVPSNSPHPYGFTGEWWDSYIKLLHLRARWYLAETGTFLSKDPVESEPAYLYVRGNPVNKIDPSGLFRHNTILNSLEGQDFQVAFAGRAGLYWLLRNAVEDDTIEPAIVDFGEPDYAHGGSYSNFPFRYPLSGINEAEARVECAFQEDRLLFSSFLAPIYNGSLVDYINLLEINASRQYPRGYNPTWRDKTVRLHYYRHFKFGRGFPDFKDIYDDFGHEPQLPDVLGFSLSLSGNVPFVSWATGLLVDRYGQTYATIGLAIGEGLAVCFPGTHGNICLSGFKRLEGYATLPEDKNETSLAGAITGWGRGGGGGSVGTYEQGIPLPTEGRSFIWHGLGAEVGFSASLGWTVAAGKETDLAWNWVDINKNSFSASSLQNVTDTSGNECTCDPYELFDIPRPAQ